MGQEQVLRAVTFSVSSTVNFTQQLGTTFIFLLGEMKALMKNEDFKSEYCPHFQKHGPAITSPPIVLTLILKCPTSVLYTPRGLGSSSFTQALMDLITRTK